MRMKAMRCKFFIHLTPSAVVRYDNQNHPSPRERGSTTCANRTTFAGVRLTLVLLLITSFSAFAQPFITTWKTDNPGVSANNQITIPTFTGGYNYNIYWEQVGSPAVNGTLTGQTGSTTITFPAIGTYRVEISGSFPHIYFNNTGDRQKILTIEQWGSIAWTTMQNAFMGCSNLTIPATDAPNLSGVTSMQSMFENTSSFNQPIGNWDVSNVIRMDSLFHNASFNQFIGNWNVSNVTSMVRMFAGAPFFNQPIGNWNVSNVTNMEAMFGGTASFNQPIGNWNVGNVTNMTYMFASASLFDQPIGNWDVSNVTSMRGMFSNTSFNQPIGNWNVGNVTDMNSMFWIASSFNQPIGNWDVSNVTDMGSMFSRHASFNQDIGNWNVSNVTDMSFMFYDVISFNQPIGNWEVSNVTNMSGMFNNATSFNQNLGLWQIGNVTNMTNMLSNSALSITSYDATLIGWAAQTVQPNITLGAMGLTYCSAVAARDKLTLPPVNWTIVGDGFLLGCAPPVIEITNEGVGIATGSSIRFSHTSVGEDQVKELEITNTGTAILVITDVEVTGDFSLASTIPPPINSGNSETLSIRFLPTDLGQRTGAITIFSNGSVPIYTLNLFGEGDAEAEVYNVVTTNANGKHDFLNIRNITLFPNNRVSIYDRWGNKVFEKDNYDNVNGTFKGKSDSGSDLADGTYYYVLDKGDGDKRLTGFLYLRR